MSDDDLEEAFIAGFMQTGEGYNGEYAGSMATDPREEAEKKAEIWVCEHNGGHNWGEWEPYEHPYSDGESYERFCKDCPARDLDL